MYWTDLKTGLIQRANLDGSQVETLGSGLENNLLRGIAVDGGAGKIYCGGGVLTEPPSGVETDEYASALPACLDQRAGD